MGFLDNLKNRFGGGNQEEYLDDGLYDDGQEDYREGYEAEYDNEAYYDETVDALPAGRRGSSTFNDHTPLVSMSDVRSQELPSYEPTPRYQAPARYESGAYGSSSYPTATAAQQSPRAPSEIRTSLPFVGDPAESLRPQPQPGYQTESAYDYDGAEIRQAQTREAQSRETDFYAADEISDPLLKKHSLSNTGDFSATSPAYYASRSGVGHVRPAGQARRSHKFREVVVVNPQSYAEAEIVANNLKRENAVVLVLSQTRPELAKRILDFSFGAAAVSDALVVTLAERIYAITANQALTEAEISMLELRGIL